MDGSHQQQLLTSNQPWPQKQLAVGSSDAMRNQSAGWGSAVDDQKEAGMGHFQLLSCTNVPWFCFVLDFHFKLVDLSLLICDMDIVVHFE